MLVQGVTDYTEQVKGLIFGYTKMEIEFKAMVRGLIPYGQAWKANHLKKEEKVIGWFRGKKVLA